MVTNWTLDGNLHDRSVRRKATNRRMVSTDVAGLDEILYGGPLQGQFYLVEGEPGAGKTTLSLRFLLEGASRGEPRLYSSLSESEREIQQVARSHDWSLKALPGASRSRTT